MSLGSGLAARLSARPVAVFAFTGYGSASSHCGADAACTWLPCERGQLASEWICGQSLGPLALEAGPLAWVGLLGYLGRCYNGFGVEP